MRKSLVRLLGVVTVLTWSVQADAAGLGGIKVTSALGQPLDAEIDLVATTRDEKSSLAARLASPEAYKGMGLDYPLGLRFTFKIQTRADGSSYLKVTSQQPVNDPFVNILVDLTWTSGRLLREYTFLLDPPGYVAEQPEEKEVHAVAPEVQVSRAEGAGAAQAATVVAPTRQPVRKPAAAGRKAPATARPATPSRGGSYQGGTVTVKHGDTLNGIAARNKPVDVSLERMLVALYRANTAQFDHDNMNRIQVGKVLHLPSREELGNVKQAEAEIVIRAQAEDWNAYRQKLASAVAPGRKQPSARQVTKGKITASVTDKAPVAKESAEGVLKLSKGESPGDGVGAGAVGSRASAQERSNAAQEHAIAQAKIAGEEQRRTGMLEKNIDDAKRLADLKAAEALAKSQSEVAAASAPEAAKPAPLLERILSEPSYLLGLAAAALGLGGLGLLLGRGGRENGGREASGSRFGPAPVAVPAAPEKAEAQPASPEKTADAVREVEQIDPLSEAGLLLNFGREAQAEEVLKEGLQKQPDNHQIHLKLLDIYAGRKDAAAFAEIARQLQGSGDQEAWQQAAGMGRKLEPDNPLYRGAEESATVADEAVAAPEIPPPADEPLEFTLESPVEAAVEEGATPKTASADDMFAGISLNLDDAAAPAKAAPANADEHWHEVATKLDLARAYHEMGDSDGARGILEEVMREGDAGQREAAQTLLDQLG